MWVLINNLSKGEIDAEIEGEIETCTVSTPQTQSTSLLQKLLNNITKFKSNKVYARFI